MNQFADVIARLHTLPSPRGVALELMQLAQRENTTVADVARIVRADPALSARLIHAANRAGSGSRTGLLHEAVLRLGFALTRQIALGFSLVNDYRSGQCAAFDYAGFWSGTLMRGAASQTVAAHVGGFNPQEAFICGLLADIGRIGLATAQPRVYAELLEREPGGAGLRTLERERFATDHAELSVALLAHWQLPGGLVRRVGEYHAILSQTAALDTSAMKPAWIMVLAQALAQGAVANAPAAWKQVALDAAARLDLDSDALNALAAGTVQEMSAWAPLLALPVPIAAAADYRAYESPDADAAARRGGLNIVLVDDDESDRYIVRHTLEEAGHHVHAVASGDEALAAIASRLPQIVITDWDMPGMDGVTLCRALRATRVGKDLYVILYTGRDKDRDLVAGIEAGADDFMVKSSSAEVLLARVDAGARAARRVGAVAGEFRDARQVAVELAASAGR